MTNEQKEFTKEFFEICLKDENYEAKKFSELLNNPSNFKTSDKITIVQEAIYELIPSQLYFLEEVEDLISRHYTIKIREDLENFLKDNVDSFVEEYFKEQFYNMVGKNPKDFKKGEFYIFVPSKHFSHIKPKIIIFEDNVGKDIRYCKFFSTNDSSTFECSMFNVIPFDLDTFKKIELDWNIEENKQEFKRLTSIQKERKR